MQNQKQMQDELVKILCPAMAPEAYERIPGLFRRWEMSQVFETGRGFHIEEAGTASDGTQLFATYRRRHHIKERSHDYTNQ